MHLFGYFGKRVRIEYYEDLVNRNYYKSFPK